MVPPIRISAPLAQVHGGITDCGGLPHSEGTVELMDLAVELSCEVDHLPINYLGFSLDGNHHSLASWEPLVDKSKAKIAEWKSSFLSRGRLTLLHFVLNGLPLYYFSLLKTLVGPINSMEKLRIDFFGADYKASSYLVKWKITSLPPCNSGLGIGSLKKKILLLSKWLWRFSIERKVGRNQGCVGYLCPTWIRMG